MEVGVVVDDVVGLPPDRERQRVDVDRLTTELEPQLHLGHRIRPAERLGSSLVDGVLECPGEHRDAARDAGVE